MNLHNIESIKEITPNDNIVIIRIDSKYNDVIKLGELEFDLDVSFEKEKHSVVNGELIKLPSKLFYCSRIGEESVEYKVPMEAKEGDNVFFHYLDISNADSEGKLMLVEGNYYMFLRYDKLYCAERNGDIIGLNGWILTSPLENNDELQNLLPDSLKQEESLEFSKVEYLGSPVEEYKLEKFWGHETNIIKKGDTVVFSKNSDIPIEYPLHKSIDKGSKYYRMQRRDIVGVLK